MGVSWWAVYPSLMTPVLHFLGLSALLRIEHREHRRSYSLLSFLFSFYSALTMTMTLPNLGPIFLIFRSSGQDDTFRILEGGKESRIPFFATR
ncbi:hypothetical protein F4805DRAFT_342614 [Annulohypoxylon moriforme]|nr:hypothetical protein F4805DRAFT_342614 [Annulohypoxylon moriforme]